LSTQLQAIFLLYFSPPLPPALFPIVLSCSPPC
jgi:hypothetical protein